jgi:hypothetical protein
MFVMGALVGSQARAGEPLPARIFDIIGPEKAVERERPPVLRFLLRVERTLRPRFVSALAIRTFVDDFATSCLPHPIPLPPGDM